MQLAGKLRFTDPWRGRYCTTYIGECMEAGTVLSVLLNLFGSAQPLEALYYFALTPLLEHQLLL